MRIDPTTGRGRSPVLLDEAQKNAMLRFAIHWLPFGGGSDTDIFIEFGIPASEFYRRLAVILKRQSTDGLSRADYRQLSKICTARSR